MRHNKQRQFQHPLPIFRYPSAEEIAEIRADIGKATLKLSAVPESEDEDEEEAHPTISRKATLVLDCERDSRTTIPTPTLRVARMVTKVLPRVRKEMRQWWKY